VSRTKRRWPAIRKVPKRRYYTFKDVDSRTGEMVKRHKRVYKSWDYAYFFPADFKVDDLVGKKCIPEKRPDGIFLRFVKTEASNV